MSFTKTDYGQQQVMEVEYTLDGKRKFATIIYEDRDHKKAKKRLIKFVEDKI